MPKKRGWWTTTIPVFLTFVLHLDAVGEDALDKAGVDALVASLIEGRELNGLVIGVLHKDKRCIFSYGSAKRGESKALDGKTIFEIGSITKPLTSLLLAKLVDDGKVELDDPIAKYLPPDTKLPRFRDRGITLLDLATHTSGLPLIPTNLVPQNPLNRYADYSSTQLLDYLQSESKKNALRSLARRVKGESA